MEVGKLYQTNQYYWMLYPSKDTATRTATATTTADDWANYWSKRLDCNVSYIAQNSMFMLLEQTDRFCKVLSTEGKVGWIYLAFWCKDDIVEVTQ
jgi:hypothetical protein